MKSRFFYILCLTILGSAHLFAQRAFNDGEQLTYVVSYRAALVPNTEVAQVVFSVKKMAVDSTPAYHVKAQAKVFPFFRWFYDMNDTYQSWMNASTLQPIKFTGEIREGKYRFDSRYDYDWKSNKVNTTYRNLKRAKDTHKTMSLSPMSYDALALLYNLRESDPNRFTAATPLTLKLVLEDTVRCINYKYLGREMVNIKGLGRFKSLKFSCQLATTSGENFADGTEFFVWISDDKNKIPLLVESPIKVGSIRAKLTEYKNLSYPLDSKLK